MREKQTIRKIGRNGALLYIPKKIMDVTGLHIGDDVSIEIDGKSIIVRPFATKILVPEEV